MTDCCSSPGNDDEFGPSVAARTATRWRRRGPLPRERAVLDPLLAHGVEGQRVVEIGGGIGQLQLALLGAGATHATNLELSPHYETTARQLATEAGHTDRITRRLGDAAHLTDPLPDADVGLLFRVTCCTTAWRPMLDTILATGITTLAITLPRHTRTARTIIAVENTLHTLARHTFRMQAHDDHEILAHARTTLPTIRHDAPGPFWRTTILTT